jgi:hypothetical protein
MVNRVPKALVAMALFLAMPSTEAFAHEFEVKHRAIATVRQSSDAGLRAEVILLMEVPPGVRATRLRVQYDLDHDGDLNAAEALLLAGDLGAETVGGYVLRQDSKPQTPLGIKSSAAFSEDGGVTVAVLVDYLLAPFAGQTSKVAVDVLETPGGGAPLRSRPLSVELQVVGAVVSASSHPMASDAAVLGPVEIAPGQSGAWVQVGASKSNVGTTR